MCNIAAYAGDRPAAPILIEMLKRQEAFDGFMGTGIVTVHEGRLYMRKVLGNTDALLRDTDALSLPGTVGIIHSRSCGGVGDEELLHPFLTADGTFAVVTNGTGGDKYAPDRTAAARLAQSLGYTFRSRRENPHGNHPMLDNGDFVHGPEVRVNLLHHFRSQGMTMPDAMAEVCSLMYADNVTVAMDAAEPDRIYALRTVRPMAALMGKGETLLSTTRFGFPEDITGETVDLPLRHACCITKDGLTVTGHKADGEPVNRVTPRAYREAYDRISARLTGKEDAPLYFDDLEFAVGREMKDIWEEEHTFAEHARIVYDVLWQLHREGRLKTRMGTVKKATGDRPRLFMWI